MRLTLRTLLAYLDKILEQGDAEVLSKKIHESELAGQLVQRIERVLQTRRTLSVEADPRRGPVEAGMMAAYLDNTLEPDQVAEVERACLDSDAHLAEAAACHQILTLVLCERVDVPLSLKERVNGLHARRATLREADRIHSADGTILRADQPVHARHREREQAPTKAEENLPGPSGDMLRRIDHPFEASRPRKSAEGGLPYDADERWTSAPDYLKKPQPAPRRWQPMAISAAIVACLVLAALRGMGPMNATHPLAQWLRGSAPRQVAERPTVDAASVDPQAPEPAAQLASDDSTLDAPASSDASAEPVAVEEAPGDESSAEEADPLFAERQGELADDAPVAGPAGEVPAVLDERTNNAADAAASVAEGGDVNEVGDASVDAPPSDVAAAAEDPSAGPASEDFASDDTDGGPETPAPEQPSSGDDVPTALAAAANPAAEADVSEGSTLINPLDPPVANRPGREGAAVPESVDQPGALGASESNGGLVHIPGPTAANPASPDVGRFLDEQQMLIHWNPQAAIWQRMPPGRRLVAGDQMMSLPTYRAPIILASGIQVTLIGPTYLEVLPPDAQQTPFLGIQHGRLTVATFASAGTTFGIRWGNRHEAIVRLADVMTTLAIEVSQRQLPGATGPAEPWYDIVAIYVKGGSAEWQVASSAPLTLPAGEHWVVINANAPERVAEEHKWPGWIDGSDARPIDPKAAQDLASRLPADGGASVIVTLHELSENRRLELRSLAVNSLAVMGEIDPLLVALNDAKMKAYWPAQFEVLNQLLRVGPDRQADVLAALQRRHGEQGGLDLMRVLRGYAPDQLSAEGAQSLVAYLDHPSSDFRLSANETLKSITGLPTLYQAHMTDRQRRNAVAKWRGHLQQGKIVYAQPPEVVRWVGAHALNSAADESESGAVESSAAPLEDASTDAADVSDSAERSEPPAPPVPVGASNE